MNKLFLLLVSLLLSWNAVALELEGARLDDRVQVENAQLVLNGAGVRSILFFKMYVAGLYLGEKKNSAEAILADTGAKRIALHVVVGDAGTERFLKGFRKGIENNHSEQELVALRERMNAFDQLFAAIKEVKKGDVIAIDWLPGGSMRVSLNGAELGRVPGEDFYRALLSIWIGKNPVSGELKKGLLGG
ncbi:MAG: chalcone isomerase family protein [Nitrosomonadales bacterium]|nr:chalcone isomerase family protein [Nitrosomonadales bacterium]